jgi:hypothetical protein
MKIPGIAVAAAFLLTACSTSPNAKLSPLANAQNEPVAIAAALANTQQPLDTIVATDRTSSKTDNKIPDLTIDQVKTLALGILKRGGRLKILAICQDSDRPLPSLSFAPTPAAPKPPAPLPDANKINTFDRVLLKEEWDKKMAVYQVAKAKFDRDLQARTQQDNARIDAFLKQVRPLISAPANCKATDILGGIARADLALNERTPQGAKPLKKVALFITDGEHNTTKATKPPAFKSKPELLVVSGGKGTGIFESLNPVKFESIEAAIVDILSH